MLRHAFAAHDDLVYRTRAVSIEPQTSAEIERDFLLHLLELGHHRHTRSFLDDALALVVRVAGAETGYLELRAPGEAAGSASFVAATDGETRLAVPHLLSKGVVAEALGEGQTVETVAALDDPRFSERDSVRRGRIGSVVCVPIGGPPAVGAVYLAARGRLSPSTRRYLELFARHTAPTAQRLVARAVDDDVDPTAPWRARLRAAADGFVGRSAAIAKTLKAAVLAAPHDVSVLITGASGTGKSALAEIIARSGPRAHRPFVALNCGALPEGLIESELFGAVPGAHSTATRRVDGKVAAADGGTLFLDEVAELAPPAQVKLLQLLQASVYFPLGSTATRRADIRVIAATNADLIARIHDGRFREDLYYRLRVMHIDIPALGERRSDVPIIARSVLERVVARYQLGPLVLSDGSLRALSLAPWPGNVRELENTIAAGALRCEGDTAREIEPEHLFPDEALREPAPTYYEASRAFQRQMWIDALEARDGNVAEAASDLGVARSHAYALIASLRVERRPRRRPATTPGNAGARDGDTPC